MASGNRGFSVHEVLDILDDSADGECTVDDEPVMEGSDHEFEDILFEEYDGFIDTEDRHTPSPTLPLPISIVTPIHSTPTNTQSLIVQTPTTSIHVINCTDTNYKYTCTTVYPMNTQSSIVQAPTTSILLLPEVLQRIS